MKKETKIKIIKCIFSCLLIISMIFLTIYLTDSFENNKYNQNYGVLNPEKYEGEFEDIVFNGIRLGDIFNNTEKTQNEIDNLPTIIDKKYIILIN